MSNPFKGNSYTYQKETFGNGSITNNSTGKSQPAHSGGIGSGIFSSESFKSYGQTPSGTYTLNNCREGANSTGGIKRCDLVPDAGTNTLGRTSLQVHEPSTNSIKKAILADSKGCIVTEAVNEMKNGDKITVKR